LGGANCEGVMGETIARNYTFVDYVFSGESDVTFPKFVKQNIAGRFLPLANKVFYGEPVTAMDSLPVPDYSDYFSELFESNLDTEVSPALVFESSRGCWWGAKHHCKFCGLNGEGMTYRAKSVGRIKRELDDLYHRWQIPMFMAADNIVNNEIIEKVFGEYGSGGTQTEPKYALFYEVKSNLNYDKLKQLADGGVRWVQPGIESLNDEILKIMDKGVSALQNVRFLRNCNELGILPIWNLLCGFPGESDEHYSAMGRLVPFIEHFRPPRGPFLIRLDRFSPYFENAGEYGFFQTRPMFGYDFIYDLPKRELKDIAYFHEDANATEITSGAFCDWAVKVNAWRLRYFSDSSPAVLAMVELGASAIVRDTRSGSHNEFHIIDPLSVKLLRYFRDPKQISKALQRFSIENAIEIGLTESLFEELSELRFLLTDGGNALSLVEDHAFSRAKNADSETHPFGHWKLSAERTARRVVNHAMSAA
jgi:ribosomal peptide maturation radical SAM protein 1